MTRRRGQSTGVGVKRAIRKGLSITGRREGLCRSQQMGIRSVGFSRSPQLLTSEGFGKEGHREGKSGILSLCVIIQEKNLFSDAFW